MSSLFETPPETPPRAPPTRLARALRALAGVPLALVLMAYVAPALLMAESGGPSMPEPVAHALLGALGGLGFALPQLGVVGRRGRFALACALVGALLGWALAGPVSHLVVAFVSLLARLL